MNRRRAVAAASLLLAVVIVATLLAAWITPALLIFGYDEATVEIADGDSGEHLATVDARVADSFLKRYVGLSATEELAADEGMLFVHDEPGEYGYVMRDMAFGIDILFISADGEVTAIHSAEPEDPPYTRYEGTGKYVLEVRYGFAEEHGIEAGDHVRISW